MNIVSRANAIWLNLSHYYTGVPCKYGHLAARRTNYRVCMECDKLKKEQLRKDKPEEVRAIKRVSYKKNQEKALKQKRIYRQANKGRINALNAARKQVIKQRTPKWLDDISFERIRNEYRLAALLTKVTGQSWHVDHVIPLQGKVVSGLHVPSNLQVMLAAENISKKNKFEVKYA